jgi:DNA polymerase I-like protein with 3'-5' exonuclease and polymerase domains
VPFLIGFKMQRKVIAIDLETHRFMPYRQAPKIVCLSWADGEDSRIVKDTIKEAIYYNLKEAIKGKILLVGHNVAYDMSCIVADFPELMELVFQAYDADAIACTETREKLLDIAIGQFRKGNYSLDKLTEKYFDLNLDKADDGWRTRYAELENVPLKQWPQRAKDYALNDPIYTHRVFFEQEKRILKEDYTLPTQFEDTRASFALKLMSTWGICTEQSRVLKLWNETIERQHTLAEIIQNAGLGRGYRKQLDLFPEDRLRPPTITKTTDAIKEAVLKYYPGQPPKTDKGAIKIGEEVLQHCNYEPLQKLIEFNSLQKLSSTYISKLFEPILHAYFDAVGAASNRTSCSGPNLQNQIKVPGLRECFIPRDGQVFLMCDFNSQEMRTLAQACLDILGKSKLASRYQQNPNFDPHLEFAQVLGGDHMRQHAKVGNFGFPGGMYPKSFVDYAKNQWGLDITFRDAEKIREGWLYQWSEMNDYFDFHSALVGDRFGTQIIPQSGFRRGMVGFKDACNGEFQTLAAHASKAAQWEVTKRCYVDRNSYLYGSRPVLFIHDEIGLETPTGAGHDAAMEIEVVMAEAMNKWTPDVPAVAEATLMDCWSKGAKRIFENERLVPWKMN